MNTSLTVGMTRTRRVLVDPARAIAFMGDDLRVYSTPSMVQDVETVCKDLLQDHLPGTSSSVGARVEIDHLGPTLVGMSVDIAVSVTAVEGYKVSFEAEVRDLLDLVGRAKHVRVVVDLTRQKQRLEAKAAKVCTV